MAGLPLQVTPRYTAADNRAGMAADLTGWADLQGGVTQGQAVSVLTVEAYRDTPFVMSFFRSGQNDSLSFVYQMSHEWKPGTIVRPHVHTIPMANPAVQQNVRVIGQYAWTFESILALPANVGWTTFQVDVPINPGDAFVEKVIDVTGGVGITPPASVLESGFLLVYFQRNGANVADTYNTGKAGGTALANLALLSFDCHFQSQKVGTQIEFPP